MPVTDEAITWAYRLLLEREPESADSIAQFRGSRDISALARSFLESEEFRGRSNVLARMTRFARVPLDCAPARVDYLTSPEVLARFHDRVQQSWTRLGDEEPYWSVLSSDQFKSEAFEANREDFETSGGGDVELLTALLVRSGARLESFQSAVEYGCGVGRVTAALAPKVGRLTAVDISSSHLALAKQSLQRRDVKNVDLVLARGADFGLTAPFDLWFSRIVLQHNPPPLIYAILRRALTMLKPGGFAVFQVPVFGVRYSFDAEAYLAQPFTPGSVEMHCLPQLAVFDLCRDLGCVVREVREDDATGHPGSFVSNTFVITKSAGA